MRECLRATRTRHARFVFRRSIGHVYLPCARSILGDERTVNGHGKDTTQKHAHKDRGCVQTMGVPKSWESWVTRTSAPLRHIEYP